MIRRTPRTTRTATLCPHTTLFQSAASPDTDNQRIEPHANDRQNFLRRGPAMNIRICRIPKLLRHEIARILANNLLRGIDRAPHEFLTGCEDDLSAIRSEEHTSELQSLMRISSVVFCLKKNNT